MYRARAWHVVVLVAVLTIALPAVSFAVDETKPSAPYEEMTYSPAGTTFTLWSPAASQVRVTLYKEGRGGESVQEFQLKNDGKGFWKMHIPSDLNGLFYTFRILYKGEWLGENPGIQPRAVGVNGHRGAILDLKRTNPPGWESDVRPEAAPFTDMLLYELHIRDFSMGKQSGIVHKGKYLALTEIGSTNGNAFSTGLDHLVDLGVTHVVLMPVFDFETDDESRPKDYIRSWNYQPANFTVPEGMYSTMPFDPASRIQEFKLMVQALHKAGIRVVMDIAFSHTAFSNGSSLALTLPGMCYRMKPDGSFSNASGYGNELATEQPSMTHYMVQTLLNWVKDYHIDGFRLDQMGVLDIESINQIRKAIDAVDPSIFLCGDGMAINASTLPELDRGLAANAKRMPGIALYNTVWENALRGNPMDSTDSGFLSGKPDLEEFVRFGIVGGIRHPQVNAAGSPGFKVDYASSPKEKIQFTSSHSGFTLFDQLNHGGTEPLSKLTNRNKLACSMVMTSQGIPSVFAGEELLRSRERIPNTALSPDSISRLDWKNKTYYNDYYEFFRGMVELRKLHPAFRMVAAQQIQKNLRFLDVSGKCVLAYVLEPNANGDAWKTILVVHNSNDHPVTVSIPTGKWTTVVEDGKVDLAGMAVYEGGQVSVPSISTLVAFQ